MNDATAISATRRQMRELADGTLALVIHIDPRFKSDFHRLLPDIDMPVALAPLNPRFELDADAATAHSDLPDCGAHNYFLDTLEKMDLKPLSREILKYAYAQKFTSCDVELVFPQGHAEVVESAWFRDDLSTALEEYFGFTSKITIMFSPPAAGKDAEKPFAAQAKILHMMGFFHNPKIRDALGILPNVSAYDASVFLANILGGESMGFVDPVAVVRWATETGVLMALPSEYRIAGGWVGA